tara:strand:- start:222 stop:782 length:561 start_codon:yes stop_codon:yes gene_type:complete
MSTSLDIGYADPPYPGMAHLYKDHPDYGGEVNHARLLEELVSKYDGFILHTSSVALGHVIDCARSSGLSDDAYRLMSWVKPFAAFKKNVPVAYAWEPVLVKPVRKPTVSGSHQIMRDWLAEPITMKRGLAGAKPRNVCWWLFEVVGAQPDDCLTDMFPGTGAVGEAWEEWQSSVRGEPAQLELMHE